MTTGLHNTPDSRAHAAAESPRLETITLTHFLAEQAEKAERARLANEPAQQQIFDVVIVGSGYGGSVAAHVLAAAAQKAQPRLTVLILERGKAFHPGDFPSTFADMPRELRLAKQDTGEVTGHEGLFDVRLGPDVAALVANGVGGGSLINAGVMLVPNPDDVLKGEETPLLRERLQALKDNNTYLRARRLLGGEVKRDGAWVTNSAERRPPNEWHKVGVFKGVAKERNTSADPVPITMSLDGGRNHAGVTLAQCNGCGDCMTGCNVGAKDSHDRNLLLSAQQRLGDTMKVVTHATVSSLVRQKNGEGPWHWQLRVLHTDARLQARELKGLRIAAHRVILAAGALGSPEILLRSRTDKLVFSAALGESFSGNGDDVSAIHRLPAKVLSAADEDLPLDRRNVGPTTTSCVRLATPPGSNTRPFLIEEFSVPGPMRRMFEEVVTTGHAIAQVPKSDCQDHKPSDRDPLAVDPEAMAKTLLVGVIGHDDAGGSLRLAKPERAQGTVPQMGALRIHWPGARWGHEMDVAHHTLAQFAEFTQRPDPQAKHPVLVANPMWRLLPPGMDTLVSQPRGPVLTVHPLGGCRMGRDGHEGVVDACGQVYDMEHKRADEGDHWAGTLVVLDGSIIGASLGVNPALTIAALALKAMEELLAPNASWAAIGPATGEPDTQPEVPTSPAKQHPARELPAPTSPTPQTPVRTELDIFERLVSEPITLRGFEPVVLELTLAFERKPIAELIGPNRIPMQLIEQGVCDGDPATRLRLYDAKLWATQQLKHVEDDERQHALLFEAPLTGSLRFFHRGHSHPLGRVVQGLWAWFFNRGKRDLWQRYIESRFTRAGRAKRASEEASRPANAPPKPSMFEAAMEFINLANHNGQKRLFDYELTLGKALTRPSGLDALLAPGSHIHGRKTLRYERRCSPWTQLTELTLLKLPGLGVQPRPVLKLDGRFLAKQNIPLLRVGSQRNHAEALAELLSFGAYLTRVLVDVHLWSFRKPDAALPREVNRLPMTLPDMPAPQVITLAVDKWPKDTPLEGQPVHIRLTRYPLRRRATGGKPLVMIHGYSASGTTFAHPTLPRSAARHFWDQGRDVWVLDLRTSCGLESARYPWAMEQPALIDIPAALLHVRNTTGQRVDVLAHCIGGAMLAMALLSDAQDIRSGELELGVDSWISSEQLGTLTAFNGDKPNGEPHPTVSSVVLSQKGPVMRYTDGNVLRAFVLQYLRRYLLPENFSFQASREPGVAEQLLDRFLGSLAQPAADFDTENPCPPWAKTPWVSTRHRVDAIFGRTFSAANLHPETLNAIDDFFGPLNWDTVAQTLHFAKWDAITNQRGRGEFLTRKRLRQRWGGIPTLALHGVDNGLADPFTLRLLEEQLGDAGVPLAKPMLLASTGHQDTLIGTGSHWVFRQVEHFLRNAHKMVNPSAAPSTAFVVGAPWVGPRLVLPQDHPQGSAGVAVMSRPDQGLSQLWMVPCVATTNAEGEPTGFTALRRLQAPWSIGDAGPSRNWLFASPNLAALPKPGAGQLLGWLCVTVYGVEEATSRRPAREWVDPPRTDGTGARQLPSAGLGSGTATRGNAMMAAAPAAPQVGLANPLGAHRSIRAGAADRATDRAIGGGQTQGPTLEDAVGRWLEQQPNSVVQEVFVRADDLLRCERLEQATGMRFALGSCQFPAGLFDQALAGASLGRLAQNASEVSLALMVGDQIYADASAGLVDPTRRDERYDLPQQRALRVKEMRRVMRRMPVQMLLDDHELVDNWEELPQDLPPDTDNPRIKALRKATRTVRKQGVQAYLRHQRMQEPTQAAVDHLDFSFNAGGHAFYMLDTRSQRQRGRPTDGAASAHIVNPRQRLALGAWLLDPKNKDKVKFIASPSMFLPRRKHNAKSLADACRSDAWDGFPDSMRWLLGLIDQHQLRHVVMLSGDEHHALHSEIHVGANGIKVVSVHASALYAPYPFANGKPRDFAPHETSDVYGTNFDVECLNVPTGDGFAVLDVMQVNGARHLRIEYGKAGDAGAMSSLIKLT